MVKMPLRKVRDNSAQDLTKTYRPTKDWPMPLEKILEQLPPEALEPPGRATKRSEGNKPSQGTSPRPANDGG